MFTQHSIMLAAVSTIFLVSLGAAASDLSKFPQEFTVSGAKSHAANGSYKIQAATESCGKWGDGRPWYKQVSDADDEALKADVVPHWIEYIASDGQWLLDLSGYKPLYTLRSRGKDVETNLKELRENEWNCLCYSRCECSYPTLVETGTAAASPAATVPEQQSNHDAKSYFEKQMGEMLKTREENYVMSDDEIIQKFVGQVLTFFGQSTLSKEEFWAMPRQGPSQWFNQLLNWDVPEQRRRLASMGPAAQCLERRRLATGGPRTPPVLAALMAEIEEAKRLYETKCR